MKTAGYWPCRNEIIAAHLSTPHKYEPFTELFDVDQLDAGLPRQWSVWGFWILPPCSRQHHNISPRPRRRMQADLYP